MINTTELKRFRYYFFDLPLWALGIGKRLREKNIHAFLNPEVSLIRKGFVTLFEYLKKSPDEAVIDDLIKKALSVKIIRESDTYLTPMMKKPGLQKYFEIEGLENVISAAELKRPVFILTGHTGSFYSSFQAVGSAIGREVHIIARSVDNSDSNPVARQLYEKTNYKLTAKKGVSSYYLHRLFRSDGPRYNPGQQGCRHLFCPSGSAEDPLPSQANGGQISRFPIFFALGSGLLGDKTERDLFDSLEHHKVYG